jgi:hypothetical protein
MQPQWTLTCTHPNLFPHWERHRSFTGRFMLICSSIIVTQYRWKTEDPRSLSRLWYGFGGQIYRTWLGWGWLSTVFSSSSEVSILNIFQIKISWQLSCCKSSYGILKWHFSVFSALSKLRELLPLRIPQLLKHPHLRSHLSILRIHRLRRQSHQSLVLPQHHPARRW